jgi:hypothetical protein
MMYLLRHKLVLHRSYPSSRKLFAAAERTDIAKAVKDGTDWFSEGIPILMNALDELTALHPFIGGALIQ